MINNQAKPFSILSEVDEKLLECLSIFKRLKVSQIKKYFVEYGKGVDSRLETLQRKKYITIDDNGFVSLPLGYKPKYSPNLHKVFDILIHFKDDIDGFYSEDYPFNMLFTMNDLVFDVVLFDDRATEVSQCALINRSLATKVIAIVNDEAHMRRLNIEKEVRYVSIDDEGELSFLNAVTEDANAYTED